MTISILALFAGLRHIYLSGTDCTWLGAILATAARLTPAGLPRRFWADDA